MLPPLSVHHRKLDEVKCGHLYHILITLKVKGWVIFVQFRLIYVSPISQIQPSQSNGLFLFKLNLTSRPIPQSPLLCQNSPAQGDLHLVI